jgi:DNA-binding response OmpR family regulator
MDRPLVMVVRETPSLADSVQLLLETVGFRVDSEPSVPRALARLRSPDEDGFRAIIVACNQPRSEMLRGYPDSFPMDARDLPLLVVGGRAAESRRVWPANVHFLGLPFEAREFVRLLNELTASDSTEHPAAATVEE